MQLREHASAKEFLAAAAPVLAADEPRHNLGFGICATLIESPSTYPVFHLWTVEGDGDTIGAALMTPPFNLWLAQPRDATAVDFLARELSDRGVELPGIVGAVPEADEFASAWGGRRGVKPRIRLGQGVYKVESPRVPADTRGGMRDATDSDRDLLVSWFDAFAREALPEDAPQHDHAETVDRRLAGRDGGLVVWEDGGPVSFAGYGGATPNGIRIGPVYTPPELRRRGYASALTARLSRRLLDEGRRYCFLFTNLANPTANRIYQNVGYELVCEAVEYVFEAD
jgi:GNAT superfamily N-acetyltransferase